MRWRTSRESRVPSEPVVQFVGGPSSVPVPSDSSLSHSRLMTDDSGPSIGTSRIPHFVRNDDWLGMTIIRRCQSSARVPLEVLGRRVEIRRTHELGA